MTRTRLLALTMTLTASSAALVHCGSDEAGGGEETADAAVQPDSNRAETGGGVDGSTPTDGGAADSSAPTYEVGGTVTGLGIDGGAPDAGADGGALASLVLQNNAGDDLTVKGDGPFTFTKKVSAYAVSVKTQPTGFTCTVANGNGNAKAAITNVAVTCAPQDYTIAIDVTGMNGTGLVATLNGAGDLTANANGKSSFVTKVKYGSAFTVAVKTSPTRPTAACTVASPPSIVVGDATIPITCVDDILPLADYAAAKTFTDAGGYAPISVAWDGVNYWTSYGGSSAGDRLIKLDAAFNVVTRYQPGRDFRSVFTIGGKGGQLYACSFSQTNVIEKIDNAGVMSAFVTLLAPLPPGDGDVVWNETGTELVAQNAGTVLRWMPDGTSLPSVALQGYGTGGENGYGDSTHILVASGYYLTYSDGIISAWTKAGVRVKSANLTASFGGAFPEYSFSYANGLVWLTDGSNGGGTWRGYDLGL